MSSTTDNITNKPNFKPERNTAIYKDYLAGMSATDIVLKHKLSFANYQRILKQQKKLAKIREVKKQSE